MTLVANRVWSTSRMGSYISTETHAETDVIRALDVRTIRSATGRSSPASFHSRSLSAPRESHWPTICRAHSPTPGATTQPSALPALSTSAASATTSADTPAAPAAAAPPVTTVTGLPTQRRHRRYQLQYR